MPKRLLRPSFVITVAGAVAQSVGCGGDTVSRDSAGSNDQDQKDAGDNGGDASGTGGYGGRGAGGTGGVGGATTDLPPCPAELPTTAQSGCPVTDCVQTLTCASGPLTALLHCSASSSSTFGNPWSTNESCSLPYDHCGPAGPTRGADCSGGRWVFLGVGGNPPAPCPIEAPTVGSPCRGGLGFGADRTHCGYRCPSGSGWTVIGCVTDDAGLQGTWRDDGACGPTDAGPGPTDAGSDR